MTQGRVRPPRWAQSLLDRVLPPGVGGASVRGDLEDELQEVAARRGAAAARRWFAWEAVKLALHYLREAAAERLRFRGERGGDGRMSEFVRHLRLAVRRLRRAPGFTAVSVATMALGIGASAAIFSVVDAVLLEPLPYRQADRLVAIWEWNQPRERTNNVANPGNFKDWRERATSFAGMSAVSLAQAVTFSADGEPQEVWAQYAHPDFFQVLGLDALLGRTLADEQDASGAREAVLSYGLWQSRFGGDPAVVGRTVQVNGSPVVVVGVLPKAYVAFGDGTELWVALRVDRGDQTNSGRWLMVVGRLADGVAFSAAADELRAISAALREEHPDFNGGWDVNPVPLKDEVVGDVQRALWVLMGAVGLLLLIACANVASLFLVRATERQKEMAVRTSLGASRGTLAAQLFVESVLVSVLGAGAGVGLAHLGTSLLVGRIPDAFALPRVEGAGVDASVLLLAVGASVLTGLLFGLVPAVQAMRAAPQSTLGAEARGPSRSTGRIRSGLVVAEVGLSMVLVAGALLFSRSFSRLLDVDSGLRPEHVLVGRVNLTGPGYSGDEALATRERFFGELEARLAASPGVSEVGGISFLPLDGSAAGTSFWRGDRPEPDPEERSSTLVLHVTGRYFQAMGITLLRGRLLDERDRADAPRAVVVNQAVVDQFYPGEDPLGKPLVVNWNSPEPWEIVGVVADVRREGLDVAPRPASYFPFAQTRSFSWQQLVVRGEGDPAALADGVRRTLAELDPTLPLGNVRPMSRVVSRAAARPRMTAFLMLLFAGLATTLASVGMYGVLSYAVSTRERELGLRVALGARGEDVVRLVMGQGLRLAVLGLALGVAGALLVGRAVAGLLYQVPAADPLSLAVAALVLGAVAVGASGVPAWRAARLAPAEALRGE